MDQVLSAEVKAALAAALDVCASVSADNLAKRGDLLASTLVNPYALRRLADALDALVPDGIATVRRELDMRRAELRAQQEARLAAYRADNVRTAAEHPDSD